MYPIYSGLNKAYCSAGESIRVNGKVTVKATYLGKVVDAKRGIYQNKRDGVFRFDMKTGRRLPAPDDLDMKPFEDKRIKKKTVVDFGDAFFLYDFLLRSGLSQVLDTLPVKRENLYSVLLFYSLSSLANNKAWRWYNGSITRMLFPDATISSPGISYLLHRLGDSSLQLEFQKNWIRFVLEHISPETDVLIDSTGLPNSINSYLTRINNHGGKVSEEMRLVLVVQRSTGIPLFFYICPGNVPDSSTLATIRHHAENLGLAFTSATVDCGYNTKANLDLFYDASHHCQIDFITRTRNDGTLRKIIQQMPDIREKENFVQYGERFLFIAKKKHLVGQNKDQPAWLYVGLDLSRAREEQDVAFRKAIKNGLSQQDVLDTIKNGGYFGILSSREYTREEILPMYYLRQNVEQTFDISKNYTKLLPLRSHNERAVLGHILLSYIDTTIKLLLSHHLKKTNDFIDDILISLRNQKATIYTNQVVIEPPQSDARQVYKEFNLEVISHLPIVENRLEYIPQTPLKKEKKRRGRPPGSLNKTTIEKRKAKEEQQEKTVKRGRGRPPGSLNKKTIEKQKAKEKQELSDKPKRGRPPGSKNLTPEERAAREAAKIKKPRGRPPGSKTRHHTNPEERKARTKKTSSTRKASQWEKAEKVRAARLERERGESDSSD